MNWLPMGFLGTRADFLMDVILVVILATPFILIKSIQWVRSGQHRKHRNVQMSLIVVIMLAVILFELNVRLSGGSGSLIEGSAYQNHTGFKWLLFFHIIVAVFSFSSWVGLAWWSHKRYQSSLPGLSRHVHKLWGKLIFSGVSLTAITGGAVYYLGFVA